MSEQLPPVPPSVPPLAPAGDKKGLAIAGFVISIFSLCLLCLSWIPYLGVVVLLASIVGLILSIVGLKSSLKGLAVAGIVLSGIALAVSIILVVLVGGLMMGPIIGNVFSKLNSNMSTAY